MAVKKSFVMYKTWDPMFLGLDDEKAGQLIKAICSYQEDGATEPKDDSIKAIFEMIKLVMDDDRRKYEEKCNKNAEFAASRWNGEKKLTHANACERIQTDADKDKDKDNDKDKDSPSEKKSRFAPPSVEEVAEYCLRRGNNIEAQQFVDYYESTGWMRGKTKIKDWKACVRIWERMDKEQHSGSQKKFNLANYMASQAVQ